MILARSMVNALKCTLIGGSVILSSACGDQQHKALEKAIDEAMAEQQQAVKSLQQRLDALEKAPELEFVFSSINHSINDQAFQPLLTSKARLQVKGDDVPQSFYLDVVLEVRSLKEKSSLSSRQVFPVVNGRSKIELHLPLPVHGLKIEEMDLTLKPLNWYRGEIISEKQVSYQ